ncbi:MAG: hypothetical protein HFJ12_05695 [Bacilli bacterium]|nr:hypothetical protein [Bacilli bacterium]
MEPKIWIQASKKSNLLDSLIYYMEIEKIDYVISSTQQKPNNDITNIIYIRDDDKSNLIEEENIPIIYIERQKNILYERKQMINYIITNLVDDDTNYTSVQKEYLFKKGIYSIFLQKIGELLENIHDYNGMIYDLTEIKSIPDNWIFNFDSIAETYSWLSKMNQALPDNFPRMVVNFYSDKVYNDSLKEINYLTEKIMEIKSKKNIIDLFICTKEELNLLRKNYFFKLLLKNISDTYRLYLVDKKKLENNEENVLSQLLDGVIIYPDCIYKDTYQDELSLGYVDCNQKTIGKYQEYFEYVKDKYGYKLESESDIDEFLK